MSNARRQRLIRISARLSTLAEETFDAMAEVDELLDSLPARLNGSERCKALDAEFDYLAVAHSNILEAMDNVDKAIDEL